MHVRGRLAKAEAEWTRLQGRSDPARWQAAVEAFSYGNVYAVARCQWRLAEALARRGHEVDVVTAGMRGLPSFEQQNGVRIHRVGGIRRRPHYSTAAEQLSQLIPTYRKTMELVRGREFDLLHCHFVVPGGAVGYLVAQRTGLPYVVTAHGSDVPGWFGPCPPAGETHSYVFTLYALDKQTGLEPGASVDDLRAAIEGHVVVEATLTAPYSRS